jgi:hypothetical protein
MGVQAASNHFGKFLPDAKVLAFLNLITEMD